MLRDFDLNIISCPKTQDVNEKMMKPNLREIGPHATFKNEKLISNTGKSHFVLEQDTFTSELSQERTLSVQKFVPSDVIVQELDAKVKSLMDKSQNISSSGSRASTFKVCGKRGNSWPSEIILRSNILRESLFLATCAERFARREIC